MTNFHFSCKVYENGCQKIKSCLQAGYFVFEEVDDNLAEYSDS